MKYLITVLWVLSCMSISYGNCIGFDQKQVIKESNDIIVNLIRPKLNSIMNENERLVFNKIKIEIPIDSNPFRARAFNRDNTPIIEISSGFLYFLYIINEGGIYSGLTQKVGLFEKYLEELNSNLISNYQKSQLKTDFQTFPEWLGDADDIISYRSNSEYLFIRKAMLAQSLAFIISHEFAHHFLDHCKKSTSIKDEYDADTYAIRMSLRAGYQPITLINIFNYYSQITGFKSNITPHGNPHCRITRFAAISNKIFAQDTEFNKFLERNYSGEDLINKTNEEINKNRKRAKCDNSLSKELSIINREWEIISDTRNKLNLLIRDYKFDQAEKVVNEYINKNQFIYLVDNKYEVIYYYLQELRETYNQNNHVIRIANRVIADSNNINPIWLGRIYKNIGLAILFGNYMKEQNKIHFEEVKTNLLKSVKYNSDISESHFHLGMIYGIENDINLAKFHLTQAMKTSANKEMTSRIANLLSIIDKNPGKFVDFAKSIYK